MVSIGTGSMIVHYLQRTEQWPDLNKHIINFSECRPPGIYKHNYVAKLFENYLEIKQDSLVFPDIPLWKHSAFAPQFQHVKSKIYLVHKNCHKCENLFRKDTYPVPLQYSGMEFSQIRTPLMEIDDVLGEELCDEQILEVQKLCTWICFNGKSLEGVTKNKLAFPVLNLSV